VNGLGPFFFFPCRLFPGALALITPFPFSSSHNRFFSGGLKARRGLFFSFFAKILSSRLGSPTSRFLCFFLSYAAPVTLLFSFLPPSQSNGVTAPLFRTRLSFMTALPIRSARLRNYPFSVFSHPLTPLNGAPRRIFFLRSLPLSVHSCPNQPGSFHCGPFSSPLQVFINCFPCNPKNVDGSCIPLLFFTNPSPSPKSFTV